MSNPVDYPLPRSAAYIWTNGDKIFLTFPGYEGNESRRFNTVTLNPQDHPKCKCGCIVRSHVLTTLFEVLKSRSTTEATAAARKISQPATPTQAQLNEALAKIKRAKGKTSVEKATDALLKGDPTEALEALRLLGLYKG